MERVEKVVYLLYFSFLLVPILDPELLLLSFLVFSDIY